MYGPQRRVTPNNLMAAGRIMPPLLAGSNMPPLEEILQNQTQQFMPQIPPGEELVKQYLQMQNQIENAARFGVTENIPEEQEFTETLNPASVGVTPPGFGYDGVPEPMQIPRQMDYEEYKNLPTAMQQAVYNQLSPEKQQEFAERAAREPLGDDYQGGPSAEELLQQGYDEAANDPMRNQHLRNQIEMTQQAGNVYQGMVDDVARGNNMLQSALDGTYTADQRRTGVYSGGHSVDPDKPAAGASPDMGPGSPNAIRAGKQAIQDWIESELGGVHPMAKPLSEEEQARKSAAIQRALARGDWRTVLKLDPGNQQGKALREQAENTMPEIVRSRLKREGLLNNQPPNKMPNPAGNLDGGPNVPDVAPGPNDFQPNMRPNPPAAPNRIPPSQEGLDATRPPIQEPKPFRNDPKRSGNIPPIAPAGEVPEATVPPPNSHKPQDPIFMADSQKTGADALIAEVKKGNIDYVNVMSDPNITDVVKSRIAQEDARSGFALSNRRQPSSDDFMGAMSGMISHYTPGYTGTSMMGRLANRNA